MHRSRAISCLVAGLLASAALVAAGPVAAESEVSAAGTPSHSVFFYKPGHAMTGVLKDGVFTRKQKFDTGPWSAAAASRDTLVLYSKKTGKVETGTFKGGLYTARESKTITAGYTNVVASCDTVLFVNRNSGAALVALLYRGLMRHKTKFTYGGGDAWFTAGCDTQMSGAGDGFIANRLSGGTFDYHSSGEDNGEPDLIASTDDSYLEILSFAGGKGDWSTYYNNDTFFGEPQDGFGGFDILAGTSDEIIFYVDGPHPSDRLIAFSRLVGGAYSYLGSQSFSGGWKIIVGGK